MHPDVSISEITRLIKSNSSKWINERKILATKFSWQSGFGAFSYSRSQLDVVTKYIHNQPVHHKKVTFKEEYLEFLDKFNIDFKDEYLFEFED